MLARSLSDIHGARPHLTFLPKAIVDAILLAEGPIGSAQVVANALGLGSRFRLARLLRRAGLPPLHRIAAWATVLAWITAAERDGVSLCAMAFHSGRHPAACYRLVKETTGLGWEGVRARGVDWVERRFLREIRRSRPSMK